MYQLEGFFNFTITFSGSEIFNKCFLSSLPIVLTSKLTDEDFDSVVLVGSKLEDLVVNSNELKIYKEVSLQINLKLYFSKSVYIFFFVYHCQLE